MTEATPGQFFLLLALGVLCLEGGFRIRRRTEVASQVTNTLILVIFLLDIFCLAWLIGQHRERSTKVHEECDQVAQSFRRSAMFPLQDRRWFRSQLSAFLEVELSDLRPGDAALSDPVEGRIHSISDSLMNYVAKIELPPAFEDRREQMVLQLSRLISEHYRLRYALRERLPAPLWGFLFLAFLVGGFLAGFGNASEVRREAVTWVSYLVISLGLLAIMQDFDDPLDGYIQTPFDNLRELHVSFLKDPT